MGGKFSDKELVDGMLNNDNDIIVYFFFVKCAPLFRHIKHRVCCQNDINALINEFFLKLKADNWHILRQFDYRISLMTWISILAIRFFVKKQAANMKCESIDNLIYERRVRCSEEQIYKSIEAENLIDRLSVPRDRLVLRKLILEDVEPQKLADEMNITVDNLYNIKRRALKRLSQIIGKEME